MSCVREVVSCVTEEKWCDFSAERYKLIFILDIDEIGL